jgi:hypothetical protein
MLVALIALSSTTKIHVFNSSADYGKLNATLLSNMGYSIFTRREFDDDTYP